MTKDRKTRRQSQTADDASPILVPTHRQGWTFGDHLRHLAGHAGTEPSSARRIWSLRELRAPRLVQTEWLILDRPRASRARKSGRILGYPGRPSSTELYSPLPGRKRPRQQAHEPYDGARISRGLARGLNSRTEYKQMMDLADTPRQGDLDGRENLSLKALTGIYAVSARSGRCGCNSLENSRSERYIEATTPG